jgi:hypothetical protein
MDTLIEGLIYRTKNYGITHNPDGSTAHSLKISFEGSIKNANYDEGRNTWGADEVIRIYHLGREAWLKGDFKTVADMFGVLI